MREVVAIGERLDQLGVEKRSLLVIPCFHHRETLLDCPELCRWLSLEQARGREIVLHGYYHDEQDVETRATEVFWRRVYTAGEAEFLRLPRKVMVERLWKGKELFALLGWDLWGFVAPAWLFSVDLLEVLPLLGFRYTTRLTGIIVLGEKRRHIPSQSLCWSSRSLWRRVVSWGWNRWLARCVRGADPVRIAIHPGDFREKTLWKEIDRVLGNLLALGYQSSSYRDYVAS
ncbi:polysaccharide deacetylase family protein [Candidatus Methylacidithermus pantelleriae]|uniref:polysaccharide deacetylase family protein n=1 Tax=Candidatus Methylacidithermus pantelleriae TaxID=2744239 RepID=UPI00157D7C3C|nr:polysaccharide deacetylase family protein [Candidatus Methylacidithermus pantelleriae]